MREYLAITQALSDETRVRALMALADGELCVCQLIELLDLSPSTVSKHMSVLQRAGLVARRKDGRWHYYRLADDDDATPLARQALRWTMANLEREKTIVTDAATLCGLRDRDREELTACYATKARG